MFCNNEMVGCKSRDSLLDGFEFINNVNKRSNKITE